MKSSGFSVVVFIVVFYVSSVYAEDMFLPEAFMSRLAEVMPPEERDKWILYVEREGIMPENYYPFGRGACETIKQGHTKQSIIDNYSEFFGSVRAKAIVEAAFDVICPELKER